MIKGCFDETFEGITVSPIIASYFKAILRAVWSLTYRITQVGDKLREMLLNELSENVEVFSAEEKAEFIFHLFRTLAVGGALCQPDSNLNRCDTGG